MHNLTIQCKYMILIIPRASSTGFRFLLTLNFNVSQQLGYTSVYVIMCTIATKVRRETGNMSCKVMGRGGQNMLDIIEYNLIILYL